MLRGTTLWKVLLIGLLLLPILGQASKVSAGINVWTSNGPDGGDISALVVDPQTSTTLYAGTYGGGAAGTYGGGVFKSVDGGATWSAVNTGLTDFDVLSLAIDPQTPTTLYMGTYNDGVFKSTNGGATWNPVNSGLTATEVYALVVDPQTSTTLYAGTEYGGGVFKSMDGGVTWSAANTGLMNTWVRSLAVDPQTPSTLYAGTDGGVFKSTDGAITWNVIDVGFTHSVVPALVVDPQTPATLYAGTQGGGVFKSTDGGATWSAVNTGLTATNVQSLVLDSQTPGTLYAGILGGGVFKSANGGATWSAVNTGLTSISVKALVFDLQMPTTLYAGTYSGGVFKSTNGGATWSAVNSGLNATDVRALAVDPQMPTTLYAAAWHRGVFKSADGGTTWILGNFGLTNTSIWSLAVDPQTPGTLYAGTGGDGLFKSADGGATWSVANTGLTEAYIFSLAIDPQTPDTLYAGTGGGVFKSTDGGATWSAANAGLTSAFVYALAVDPQTPTTLYAGTGSSGVFESADGGATWNAINTGLMNTYVKALAVDPQTPSTLYVGTAGGVFKSTDGGAIWSSVNTGLTDANIRALTVDPQTPTTLYAGTYGGGVFKSINGGAAWNAVNTGLMNTYVRALAVDPQTPAMLYTGTRSNGVFSIQQTAVLPAPTLSSIDNGGGGNYTVSWSSISGATSYTLQEAISSEFTDATTIYFGSNTATSISSKAPGTYYYRVQASGASGDSAWSNTQSVVVVAPPTAPTLNAIANADGDGEYTVSWSSVSGATSYTLQEATNSSFSNATTAYSGSEIPTEISGKAPGTFYYRVQASNTSGDSTWSNTQSVVVIALPTAPTLNAIANADGDGNYNVSWSAVSAATGYTLQEASNSSFTGTTTAYSGSGTTTSITGRTPGTYYYRVRSSNIRGDSAWSSTQSVVVVALPTAPTLNAIANADGDGDYSVSWSSVSGATGYTLQEATNSSFTGATSVYSGVGTSTNISGKTPDTYYYRVRASNASGDSTWSNIESLTVTQVTDGDPYETDDTCAQASAILNNGTVQERTFHQQADEDWVVFTATAEVEYRIEAQVPPGSPADITLELYDQCTGLPLESQNYAFAAGVRLDFESPTSGPLYLHWTNSEAAVYGVEVVYHISVRALATEPTPGALIIVAGKLKPNDSLQPNIHYVANQVYQLFQTQGYDPTRIYYLATDLSLPGVDALATVANLQAALTTWAVDKVGSDRALTLYLVDHGFLDQFYLNKPAGQWVTPEQIDTWLTQLETACPGVKINVIIEACHAGSFIHLPQTVSRSGRVVIASTGAYNLAHTSPQGAVFSDYFVAALGQGESLYAAFQTARWATLAAHTTQTPWLDDNGNGIPNEAQDGLEATLRGFAYGGTLSGDQWSPHILAATGPSTVTQGQGVIRAEVRDDEQVRRVWAVIYPPSYTPPQTGEELVSEVLPTIVLAAQGNGQYAATYTGFDEMGTYRVVVYAEDNGGREARPVAIQVQIGWAVYLPVVIRQ